MPTIELPKRRTNKERQYVSKDQNLWAQEVYASSLWRKLRDAQLQKFPLCEMHLMYDRVVPARCVHHMVEISQAGSRLEAYDIGYDSNNLMSLCEECHNRYHRISHSGHSISKEDSVFLNKYRQLCRQKNGDQ